MRHILGEDLDVGCVLSWGPCWYAQKQFFEGKVHPLSTPDYLMRYDVEVSGFPSSHAGHLCLLRLKEDDYPGTTRIEEWPSWDLPVLKWGKSQGGVVGFSHSGWGLKIADDEAADPTRSRRSTASAPTSTSSTWSTTRSTSSRRVDTPAPWELNIWYHTLNCGYRARISGETDFPCIYGERVGLGRVYVKLADGKLDFDRWCEGIKQGRSLRHRRQEPPGRLPASTTSRVGESGSELKLDAAGHGEGHGAGRRASSTRSRRPRPERSARRPLDEKPYWDLERARIGDDAEGPRRGRRQRPAGRQDARSRPTATSQDVAFDVPIEKSSWVALRIYPSSHTNPVFVLVGGKPIRASKKSAEWCLKAVDQCWSQKEPAIRAAESEAARKAYDVARDAYKTILAESEGD